MTTEARAYVERLCELAEWSELRMPKFEGGQVGKCGYAAKWSWRDRSLRVVVASDASLTCLWFEHGRTGVERVGRKMALVGSVEALAAVRNGLGWIFRAEERRD